MTRGFVTIATGKENYYVIAANLLASYRHYSAEPLPFALICDAENEYSAQFDDVVLLDNPHCSYLDKLALPRYAPYDETIFIDSDCLAYRDLNAFWRFFKDAADFTAFGMSHPTTFNYAWFKKDDIGEYADRIEFIPDFIGGVYFIRKTKELDAFDSTCAHIHENYYRYKFRQFEDPCDEPIFALAMAAHGFEPVDNEFIPICFYPHVTAFKSDISRGLIKYKSKYEPAARSWAYMVHWASGYTWNPPYTTEVARLKSVILKRGKLATACSAMRVSAPYHAKERMKWALSKLHLLDAARSVKYSLESRLHRN